MTENDKRGTRIHRVCARLDFHVAITVTRRKIALHGCVCQKQRARARAGEFNEILQSNIRAARSSFPAENCVYDINKQM